MFLFLLVTSKMRITGLQGRYIPSFIRKRKTFVKVIITHFLNNVQEFPFFTSSSTFGAHHLKDFVLPVFSVRYVLHRGLFTHILQTSGSLFLSAAFLFCHT